MSFSSASEYTGLVSYFGGFFNDIYVHPVIFLEFLTTLLFAFTIRFIVLYNIEKNKGFKTNVQRRRMKAYIIGHCIFEYLMGFVLGYIIIKITYANHESYIINMIIAPGVGLILSIYIDNKFIIPLESTNDVGSFTGIRKKTKESNNSNSNVVVNINNGDTNRNDEENQDHHELAVQKKPNNINHLDESLSDDDSFSSKVISSINEIIDLQNQQSMMIDVNTKKITSIIDSVDILKETELIDKKLEIKLMIYNALNAGFVTPEINDQITLKYYAYRKLGGNHEIQTLYEDHYLKLQVHEDRRKNDIPVEKEKRHLEKKFKYGEFDNE